MEHKKRTITEVARTSLLVTELLGTIAYQNNVLVAGINALVDEHHQLELENKSLNDKLAQSKWLLGKVEDANEKAAAELQGKLKGAKDLLKEIGDTKNNEEFYKTQAEKLERANNKLRSEAEELACIAGDVRDQLRKEEQKSKALEQELTLLRNDHKGALVQMGALHRELHKIKNENLQAAKVHNESLDLLYKRIARTLNYQINYTAALIEPGINAKERIKELVTILSNAVKTLLEDAKV